jgi:CheY-like chemotaxis protein
MAARAGHCAEIRPTYSQPTIFRPSFPLMEILLVEDSPEVSLITVEYLTELGHQVVAVTDAELAVEQVAARKFDAVMTDVSLPGMSGIDLARELVKKYPKLPVVIASGYGALNLDGLVGQPQVNVLVLPKPYDMDMLEKTLHKAATFSAS